MRAVMTGTGNPRTRNFYRDVLLLLRDASVPSLVGGAYALEHLAGLGRRSKDLDLFLRPPDCAHALRVLAQAGYRTELTHPHWLAKAFSSENQFVDLVFNAGNGAVPVDDLWFEYAVPAEVLGLPVSLCPAEETIWSKAYIMERERYDGADVAHLLRARAETLDWQRLLWRFGGHWRVLLSYLVLFGFIYPGERDRIPAWVIRELLHRCEHELSTPAPDGRVCQGGFLSRSQYLIAFTQWHYADARLAPPGTMSPEQIASWTEAAT